MALPDGSVLVASNTSAERYEPATDSFTFLGVLTVNRGSGLTATLLADGRVLLVGGQPGDFSEASAELYDPITGTFSPTGSMATPRSYHTATLLADGRVLVTGGHEFNLLNSALATAEVYDPVTGAFAPAGSMSLARQDHTATLLPDGRVLIAGGYSSSQLALSDAETFHPATGTFTATGAMAVGRGNHTATSLANGNVLIAGGHSGFPANSLASVEIYDAGNGSFAFAGDMTIPRGAHTATPLSDGTILIVGGFTAFPSLGTTLASAEIYDPVAGSFALTGSMHVARGRHAAALLPSGNVLVAGGFDGCCSGLSSAEVFSTSLVDTQPPTISVPADFSLFATGPDGAVVFFFVSATDDIDSNPQLVCDHSSGSTFPIATTTVLCTATDSAGNTATASFQVTVIEPLTIAITLNSSGSVDSKTGIATMSGTVSCSRPTQFFFVQGELVQTIANRAVLRGSFFTQVDCVQPSGIWSATVSASNGRFKAGKADATITGFGCDQLGSCDSAGVGKPIQLRGNK